MSGKQSDVSLVRARDEASKAVSAIEGALGNLISTQRKVAAGSETAAGGLSQVIGVLAQLDRAYSRTADAGESGAAALERQARAIASNKAQFAALEQQQHGAARAADQLRVALVDALLTNADAGPLRAQLGEVTGEMRRLETEAGKLQRAIQQQEGGFTRSASTLAELERQTRLAGSVSTFAAKEADDFTASLERQTAAAQRNAQLLRTIDRSTNSATGKSAEDSASVFARAGLTDIEKQFKATTDQQAAVDRVNDGYRQQAAEIAKSEAAQRALTASLSGKSARGSASVFEAEGLTDYEQKLIAVQKATDEAAADQKQMVEATARLRAELNPLGVIQEKLNTELAEANLLYKAGKINATELAQAELLLKTNADRAAKSLGQQTSGGGKPTLFGLKPYELTNLGYQVNDVVTQLASGTSLSQTLAQQGGQILQIFPRAGAAIVSAFTNPAVIAFTVTIGAVILALKEAGDEAERLRGFMGLLAASADGSSYGVAKLNAASEALDRYGLSAADAVAVVRTFVQEGIDQSRLEEFGRTAQDLSEVLGIKVTDAAKQVADAFTGGYDAIQKLDDATNFLTATQRDNIKSLFDQGKAAEARNEALRIFSDRQEDAANKMRGPWADATRSLGGAWQDFLNVLSDTAPIKVSAGLLAGLAKAASEALREIDGVTTRADVSAQIARAQTVINNLEQARRNNPALAPTIDRDLADRRTQLAALQRQYETLTRAQNANAKGDTIANRPQLEAKQSADLRAVAESAKTEKTAAEAAAAARREATEYVEKNFKFASDAAKQAYITQKAEEARTIALKKAADERKREANEAKRLADEQKRERERLAKQTVFQAPVDGRISSGFGARAAPKEGASTFHRGIDFAVPVGTAVKAPANGVVVETGYDSKLGKFVYVDHGKGVISKFGHCRTTAW